MVQNLHFRTGRLRYRDIGDGTPLLLLHGFGADGNIWDAALILLRDNCRLLIADLPGFGGSEVGGSMHMGDYADAMIAVLDHAGVDGCTVVGHSMGGYVALDMASRFPERMEGLALVHSHARPDPPEKRSDRQRAAEFVRMNGSAAYLRSFVPGLFAPGSPKILGKALLQALEGQTAEGLALAQEAMASREGHEDTLRRLPLPVLIVLGEEDALMPAAELAGQAALPERALLRILPGAGHMAMVEQAPALASAINDYLEWLEASR